MFWRNARRAYAGVTAEDQEIRRYLELAPSFQADGYRGLVGLIHDWGHRWVARRTVAGPVLEIGSGAGRHGSRFVDRSDFFFSEYSSECIKADSWKQFRGRGIRCDARQLPFRSASLGTVISIYNLEHIADLARVLQEVHRVLKPAGAFLIALPCEGGLLWNIGRELSTRRQFQSRYGLNYDKIIAYEHVWDFPGVLDQIRKASLFRLRRLEFLPMLIPTHHTNLVACVECTRAG